VTAIDRLLIIVTKLQKLQFGMETNDTETRKENNRWRAVLPLNENFTANALSVCGGAK
jgi:hypothetical protein